MMTSKNYNIYIYLIIYLKFVRFIVIALYITAITFSRYILFLGSNFLL